MAPYFNPINRKEYAGAYCYREISNVGIWRGDGSKDDPTRCMINRSTEHPLSARFESILVKAGRIQPALKEGRDMPLLQAVCEYKKVKNCSIRAALFLPPVDHPPVVLYLHGGALISGSRRYLPGWQLKRLKQAGFAVVAADYRLAPETKLAEIVTDVTDALRWVKREGADQFGWDASRFAVMGSSAGGYLSLLSGTLAERPNAIVSFYGYGDILGEWYTRPSEFYCQRARISRAEAESTVGGREKSTGGERRYTFYFYCRQQGIWPEAVSGYDPQREREKLLPYCPVVNITPEYPATLLLHGDQDTDVPYEQSLHMAQALDQHHIENRLITVPGAGHGFDGDGTNPAIRQYFDQVVEFLQRHC